MDKNVKQLIRKASFQQDPTGSMHNELSNQTDALTEIGDVLKSPVKIDIQGADIITIKGAKGDKGDKGDIGEKGEIGPKGDRGDKGEDAQMVGPQGPSGKDAFDGINGQDGKDGKDGRNGDRGPKGDKGDPGKDAKNLEPKEIVKLLKSLPEKEKLSISDLRNSVELQSAIGKIKSFDPNGFNFNGTKYKFSELMHGGSSSTGMPAAIEFLIEGAGSTITTGIKGDLIVPYNCVISGWALYADQIGSIVIDVLKSTPAAFPPTVSITGTDIPTLSSQTNALSVALTGWTTTLNTNDVLRFKVNSATTITRVTISLKITKS